MPFPSLRTPELTREVDRCIVITLPTLFAPCAFNGTTRF
jgi:hypothetical protein